MTQYSSLYSICPASAQAALNAFFIAFGWGTGTYDQALTTDVEPDYSSPATHFHNYNASANPNDYALLSWAKAGTLPTNDMFGAPIPYGVGDVVSEADALAAFATLELWANNSERSPATFMEEQRNGLATPLAVKPVEV